MRAFDHNKPFKKGTDLRRDQQEEVKRSYVNRYTGDHKPLWASRPRPSGEPYPIQFRDDAEWLEHTLFQLTAKGKLADADCWSTPTFPPDLG